METNGDNSRDKKYSTGKEHEGGSVAKDMWRGVSLDAVERIQHTEDSQGHILALAGAVFQSNVSQIFKVFHSRSVAERWRRVGDGSDLR